MRQIILQVLKVTFWNRKRHNHLQIKSVLKSKFLKAGDDKEVRPEFITTHPKNIYFSCIYVGTLQLVVTMNVCITKKSTDLWIFGTCIHVHFAPAHKMVARTGVDSRRFLFVPTVRTFRFIKNCSNPNLIPLFRWPSPTVARATRRLQPKDGLNYFYNYICWLIKARYSFPKLAGSRPGYKTGIGHDELIDPAPKQKNPEIEGENGNTAQRRFDSLSPIPAPQSQKKWRLSTRAAPPSLPKCKWVYFTIVLYNIRCIKKKTWKQSTVRHEWLGVVWGRLGARRFGPNLTASQSMG